MPKSTDRRHSLGDCPNRLREASEPSSINEGWVGDLSDVPLAGGEFCNLAMLMDRFSRRIVGWHLADSLTEDLVTPVLLAAIHERQPDADLIHHTDRGGPDASTRDRALLRRAELLQRMSRADNCDDNAVRESGFGTFKTKLEMTDNEPRDARSATTSPATTSNENTRRSLTSPVRTPPG